MVSARRGGQERIADAEGSAVLHDVDQERVEGSEGWTIIVHDCTQGLLVEGATVVEELHESRVANTRLGDTVGSAIGVVVDIQMLLQAEAHLLRRNVIGVLRQLLDIKEILGFEDVSIQNVGEEELAEELQVKGWTYLERNQLKGEIPPEREKRNRACGEQLHPNPRSWQSQSRQRETLH